MSKIEKLTAEQQARFPEFIKKWTDIGLSTEPADRPKAEAAIIAAYAAAGLKAPKIVWCGSPLSQGLTRAIILDKKLIKNLGASVWDSVGASVWDSVRASMGASVWDSVRASVGASVWDSMGASVRASVWDSVWASVRASVWDSVWDSVRASMGASVWDSVRASVGASVGASVWDSVGASVWASVWDSVWDSVGASVWDSMGASVRASVWDSVRDSMGASVWDSVRASVGDSVRDSGYGQHDASWIGFYDFFRSVLSLKEQTEKLQGLVALTQSAGWFLPHANICWVSERHHILARDDRGRLHSLSGPAVAYHDGWAIYAVHGVRVPADVVENPNGLTADRIEKEQNAEIRRVMIEQMGYERYILESGAKLLHTDEVGSLYQKQFSDDEPLTMVHVLNSTPELDGSVRKYMLRCHPELRPLLADQKFGAPQAMTARNAVASTFGLRGEAYTPMIET